jgi:hypothetical protein
MDWDWQTNTAIKDDVIDSLHKEVFRLEQWWSDDMLVPNQLADEEFTQWIKIQFPKIKD